MLLLNLEAKLWLEKYGIVVDQGEVYNFHFSWCDLLFASRTSHIFFCTKDSGTASTLFCWVNLAPHFSHGLISMPSFPFELFSLKVEIKRYWISFIYQLLILLKSIFTTACKIFHNGAKNINKVTDHIIIYNQSLQVFKAILYIWSSSCRSEMVHMLIGSHHNAFHVKILEHKIDALSISFGLNLECPGA